MPRDLCERLRRPGRAVDAQHAPLALLRGEPDHHPGLRAARDRAHDDGVEEDAQLPLLLGDLARPARVAEPAERVIRRARRDRVRLAAAGLDVGQRRLPALLEPDPEAGLDQPHVGAEDAAELDVPDAVVHGVRPVDPALLHEHAVEPEPRRDRGHLARVVRLHAADRDERVAALRERVGGKVLELARLVAAECEPAGHVVALGPDRRTAELGGEPVEPVHRRRAEEQLDAGERLELHRRRHYRSSLDSRKEHDDGGSAARGRPGGTRPCR